LEAPTAAVIPPAETGFTFFAEDLFIDNMPVKPQKGSAFFQFSGDCSVNLDFCLLAKVSLSVSLQIL